MSENSKALLMFISIPIFPMACIAFGGALEVHDWPLAVASGLLALFCLGSIMRPFMDDDDL